MATSILQPLLLRTAAKPINLMSSTAFERLTKDLWRAKGTIQPGKPSFLSACPALPLSPCSPSPLYLAAFVGLSPILSNSEKVPGSESPPPLFLPPPPFLSSFFKVVFARDGRAFSALGSLPRRFVACPSIVLPKAVQVQQGFVWLLNTD